MPPIYPKYIKTLTLAELIIAISLLAVIILGASSFDLGSRQMLRASERKTQILNEATLILDHVSKNALLGIGDVDNPAFSSGTTPYNEPILLIKQDTNLNGIREADDIDLVVGYAQDSRQGHEGEIFFCPDTRFDHRAGEDPLHPHQVLTNLATAGGFNFVVAAGGNTADINVTLRFDRTRDRNAFDNPEVTAQTTVETSAQSLQ
jgi:hypothetical protein